jgi:hypothetical protein
MNKKKVNKKTRKEMILNIRYFFLNNPVEKVKESLWDLYRMWVHGSDNTGSDLNSGMLLFYEYLIELIEELDRGIKF